MTDFTTRLPRDLYRAEQVRQLDAIAIEHFSITGFTLMKRAAMAALEALLEVWPQTRTLLVFVGAGNNGGDGYVLAGLARDQQLAVTLVVLHGEESLHGDALLARQFAAERDIPSYTLAEAETLLAQDGSRPVIVDALLGTGLSRAVSGDYERAINLINASGCSVLSIDVPSGLNADTGNPSPCAVHADLTVTFIAMKQGLLTGQARSHVGSIRFAALEVPDEVYQHVSAPQPPVHRIDINETSRYLTPRAAASHKGSNGHAVIIGGELGFGGAVIMAAEAAARTGAGLVSVISRSAHRSAMLSRCPEVMFHGTEDEDESSGSGIASLLERATVIAIGPGLGRGSWSRDLFQAALAAQRSRSVPLVIDADALHLLAERRNVDANLKREHWLLTPHPGEAAQLLGETVSGIQQDRFAALDRLVATYGGCCLLKGSGSLVKCQGAAQPEAATGNPVLLCSEGNPGMGSGGMGDVLSGILAGLLAQGMNLRDALACAVCIHGEAADLEAAEHGARGILATDLLRHVAQLVNPRH